MSTLWHGRFGSGPDQAMLAFTASLGDDRRLFREDVAGSRAHVRGLARVGLLTDTEARSIVAALDQTEQELETGTFEFQPSDEDIHTAVERRVTDIAGMAGGKLHTGRSRNDQTVTNTRLYCKRELQSVALRVLDMQETLLARAELAGSLYLPAYTHLQRAQPVLLAHHLCAHAWALARDVDRLCETRRRTDVSPLGAGALAGSSLPLDPDGNASDLGFARCFDNSLDAVSDRDFVADSLYALTVLALHLSRIGEELVLWSSEEFGFVKLDDRFSTGSSMMPQKKNPDIAELVRGKAGRLIGNLTGTLAMLKSLPLAYNRDLGEDKAALFDSFDQMHLALPALTGMIATVEFNAEKMMFAADSETLLATDLADWLVRKGTPFREAHAIVGSLVRRSVDEGFPLVDLVASEPHLGPEAAKLLEPGTSVQRRITPGGGGVEAVAAQLGALAARIEADRSRI